MTSLSLTGMLRIKTLGSKGRLELVLTVCVQALNESGLYFDVDAKRKKDNKGLTRNFQPLQFYVTVLALRALFGKRQLQWGLFNFRLIRVRTAEERTFGRSTFAPFVCANRFRQNH